MDIRSLQQAIRLQRQQLFIGRDAELQHVQAWLEHPLHLTQILSVTGIGGIGKSTFLSEALRLATEQQVESLWLDCRASPSSPQGFIAYAHSLLKRLLPANPPHEIVSIADLLSLPSGRLLLAIDNFDALFSMSGWLREDLLGQLPERGVLVLLASRQVLPVTWTADPAWRERLIHLPLEPFSRQEAQEFLNRTNAGDSAEREQLLRQAAGHPLALAIGSTHLQGHRQGAQAMHTESISAHLLHEVVDPGLVDALEALVVLSEADSALISAVSGSHLDARCYHRLAELSFVMALENRLVLHDVAQAHLLADLKSRTPAHFRQLRRRAAEALAARLQMTVRPQDRRQISAALLRVCQDALSRTNNYADFSFHLKAASPTSFRPQDRPALHEILTGWWGSQQLPTHQMGEEHRLLDAICDRFPEYLSVIRLPDGQPVAFMAMVLLYRETAALVERYRLGSFYLKQCPGRERAAMDCPREEADTYFWLLAGGRPNDSYSAAEQRAIMFYHFFSHLGMGLRGIGIATHPDVYSFVSSLGLMPRPECDGYIDGASHAFRLSELDLRRIDFGEWVLSFLDRMEAQDLRPEERGMLPSARGSHQLVIECDQVREALELLHDPIRLHSTELALRLGCSGTELRARMIGALQAGTPPPPMGATTAAILRATYVQRAQGSSLIADGLHLSRATYYRKLKIAIEELTAVLSSPVS